MGRIGRRIGVGVAATLLAAVALTAGAGAHTSKPKHPRIEQIKASAAQKRATISFKINPRETRNLLPARAPLPTGRLLHSRDQGMLSPRSGSDRQRDHSRKLELPRSPRHREAARRKLRRACEGRGEQLGGERREIAQTPALGRLSARVHRHSHPSAGLLRPGVAPLRDSGFRPAPQGVLRGLDGWGSEGCPAGTAGSGSCPGRAEDRRASALPSFHLRAGEREMRGP